MLEIINSCNCTYTSHVVSYIPPKCCKVKEPKTRSCLITNNVCDADVLHKSSNKAQLKQHCLI